MKCKRNRGRPPKLVPEVAQDGFAPNLDVLGEQCGVDRKTIDNARKRFTKDAPKKRADGRYPITEYRQWLEKHGVLGRRKASELVDERDIRLAHAQLRLERERFEFEQVKERMLPVAQFELALSKTMAAFLAALNAFAPRINEQLEGLDFDDRSRLIEQEIELLRKKLASCDYLYAEEDEPDDE